MVISGGLFKLKRTLTTMLKYFIKGTRHNHRNDNEPECSSNVANHQNVGTLYKLYVEVGERRRERISNVIPRGVGLFRYDHPHKREVLGVDFFFQVRMLMI